MGMNSAPKMPPQEPQKLEQSIDFGSPDRNMEKPRTFKEYYDQLKAEIDRLEKLSLSHSGAEFADTFKLLTSRRDELSRLDGYVDMYTGSLDRFESLDWEGKDSIKSAYLDRPISVVIDDFSTFIRENNDNYKQKFGSKKIDELHEDEKEEAESLIGSINILEKIISKMERFEQGQ